MIRIIQGYKNNVDKKLIPKLIHGEICSKIWPSCSGKKRILGISVPKYECAKKSFI